MAPPVDIWGFVWVLRLWVGQEDLAFCKVGDYILIIIHLAHSLACVNALLFTNTEPRYKWVFVVVVVVVVFVRSFFLNEVQ